MTPTTLSRSDLFPARSPSSEVGPAVIRRREWMRVVFGRMHKK